MAPPSAALQTLAPDQRAAVELVLRRGLSYGELAVPVAFFVVGALLVPASSALDDRTVLMLGSALMVLAAVGALLALNSVGQLYPRGLVGLGAGVLLWVVSALRSGLLAPLQRR